jgi:hypothetical protein
VKPLTDEELIAEMRAGNAEALGVLFDRYYQFVLLPSFALRAVAGRAHVLPAGGDLDPSAAPRKKVD